MISVVYLFCDIWTHFICWIYFSALSYLSLYLESISNLIFFKFLFSIVFSYVGHYPLHWLAFVYCQFSFMKFFLFYFLNPFISLFSFYFSKSPNFQLFLILIYLFFITFIISQIFLAHFKSVLLVFLFQQLAFSPQCGALAWWALECEVEEIIGTSPQALPQEFSRMLAEP